MASMAPEQLNLTLPPCIICTLRTLYMQEHTRAQLHTFACTFISSVSFVRLFVNVAFVLGCCHMEVILQIGS